MPKRPLLYGANGKPLEASAWDSSSTERRARHWTPTSSHINALLSGEVDTIRRRARDEVRRNPWAKKSLDSFVANAVGTGIRPKPVTNDEKFRSEILDLWNDWVEEADVQGCCSFYGLQSLATRAFAEGGDCFIRLRDRRPRDGLVVPLQLQLLEAEMCDSAKNMSLENGGTIKAGVEFDSIGRRRAYWMFREHPGESVRSRNNFSALSVAVPASQVIAIFQVLRPGQVRGVPGLATVLAMLRDIREADDAHLQRQKIQNLYATFEEVPANDSESVLGGGDLDDDDVPEVTAAAGSHVLLPPGHKITFGSPPSGSSDYEAFVRVKLRAAAAGAGVTYEQATGDLSGVNFSSIRAGLIEFRRTLEQIQHHVLIFQLCRRVWRRWFEAAVLSGALIVPEAERPNMRKLLRPLWQPPGFEYVEPEKDVKASVRRIRAGLSSRTREAAKLGIDVEDLDREIAADNLRAEQLGLILTSNAQHVSDAGVGQGADPSRFNEETGEVESDEDDGETESDEEAA